MYNVICGDANDSFRDRASNEFTEIVYNEGNSAIDPYKLIVDSACPKTVTGRSWMDSFIESKHDVFIKRYKENESFKFGPSKVYKFSENYEIDVQIGNLIDKIRVSVVDADIPLLLGLDYQEKWGMIIDIGRKEIKIRKSQETFSMDPNASHWTLPIQGEKRLHSEARSLVYGVNMNDLDVKELRKYILRIHKNLSHKSENQMIKLFKMAEKDTKDVKNMIKDVVNSCRVCKIF